MAENKKSIIFYVDYIHTFEGLTDAQAGRLIKHLLRYVNDKNPKAPDKITQIAFEPIKQQLKRDLVKWEKTIEGKSKAGKASAAKRQHNPTKPTPVESVEQNPTNPTDNVSVNVTVTDTVNVNDNVSVIQFTPDDEKKSDWFIVVGDLKVYDVEAFCMQNFEPHFVGLAMKPFWPARHKAFHEYHGNKIYTDLEDFRSHYTAFILSNKGNNSNEKSNKSDASSAAIQRFVG